MERIFVAGHLDKRGTENEVEFTSFKQRLGRSAALLLWETLTKPDAAKYTSIHICPMEQLPDTGFHQTDIGWIPTNHVEYRIVIELEAVRTLQWARYADEAPDYELADFETLSMAALKELKLRLRYKARKLFSKLHR